MSTLLRWLIVGLKLLFRGINLLFRILVIIPPDGCSLSPEVGASVPIVRPAFHRARAARRVMRKQAPDHGVPSAML